MGADGKGEDGLDPGRGGRAWGKFSGQCGLVLSLGPQTLSHDLALVVLLEQIYRVESWRAGHPYHRE